MPLKPASHGENRHLLLLFVPSIAIPIAVEIPDENRELVSI
jgi:hypothetical protein